MSAAEAEGPVRMEPKMPPIESRQAAIVECTHYRRIQLDASFQVVFGSFVDGFDGVAIAIVFHDGFAI